MALRLFITSADYQRKDPVFWIEAQTTLNKYKQKKKNIPRYYSELEKLCIHLSLSLEHTLIPSLPAFPVSHFDKEGNQVRKQWWLNIKLPNEQSDPATYLVDPVESKIQLWLDRLTENESVQESEILREFIESEIGFRPLVRPRKQSKALLIHVSEKDMDPEFNFWTHQLNSFLNQLQLAFLKSNRLIQEHTVMADYWISLSSSFVSYGALERNSELFIIYKSITKACQRIHDMQRSQGLATLETIGSEISYQIKNTKPAQNAMQRRLTALSEYISSKKHTESSLRGVERMKQSTSINRERASEAIVILENARLDERECMRRYEKLNENLRDDIEYKYKPHVSKDIKDALREYATSQLYLERKKLLIWQEIMGEK